MKLGKCEMCGIERTGRGSYFFDYLEERVYICGKCASKVMKFIKENK